jgi:hypothetical protein
MVIYLERDMEKDEITWLSVEAVSVDSACSSVLKELLIDDKPVVFK